MAKKHTKKTVARDVPVRKRALREIEKLHHVEDLRAKSQSVLVAMRVQDYLTLVDDAFKEKGGIEWQREVLTTSSAKQIRDRMANDLRHGAILPPVVVGILVKASEFAKIPTYEDKELCALLQTTDSSTISIIDGMQRTAVLHENLECLKDKSLRVELWIATSTTSLTYRMLVLNTGQTPWNLRRQIEVIHASLIKEIRDSFPAKDAPEIYSINEQSRRTNPGEYQANEIIEMWMAFGLRKVQVDKDLVLAEQFSRLDMVEAVAREGFFQWFTQVFAVMIKLDRLVSKVPSTPKLEQPSDRHGERRQSEKSKRRFDGGRSLFDSQPACVGFMAAAAQHIFGRPGVEKPESEQAKNLALLLSNSNNVLGRLSKMSKHEEIRAFLDFDTLNEVLDRGGSKGSIGEFERTTFLEAFRLFFKEGGEHSSMRACWRSGT